MNLSDLSKKLWPFIHPRVQRAVTDGIIARTGGDALQGPQGPQGVPGAQGPAGVTGAQGNQGATGPQGLQGAQGEQGAQGNDGATGATGPQGAQGLTGAQGFQGPQGDQGAQGNDGAAGATGPQGVQGAQGVQGSVGAQGSIGAQGFQGSTGATGPQGTQGAIGPQGYQGNQGSVGAQGAGFTATSSTSLTIGTGSRSLTTQAGLAYAVGARIRVARQTDVSRWMEGTITAYNNGTGALTLTVDLIGGSGTYNNWNIFAGGVQGNQGPQGAIGAQGPTGLQGSQGPTGTTGAQGPTGAQGNQGLTGAKGAPGAQGSQGATGATGAQGPRGFRGFQGLTGSQGATGPAGSQGATGATGAQGPRGFRGFQGATGAQGITGAQGSQGPQGAQGLLGSVLASAVAIASGGYFKIGSGTKDSTLDGIQIDHAEIVGQLDGSDQFSIGLDGRITIAKTSADNSSGLVFGNINDAFINWRAWGDGFDTLQLMADDATRSRVAMTVRNAGQANGYNGIISIEQNVYDTTATIEANNIELGGNTLKLLNSTYYNGRMYVPLQTPITSAPFNLRAFSTVSSSTLVDTSSVWGLPAGISAMAIDIATRDSAAWGSGEYYIAFGPSSTYWYQALTSCYGANLWSRNYAIVNCNANGDIYYRTVASGTSTLDVLVRVWGYFI